MGSLLEVFSAFFLKCFLGALFKRKSLKSGGPGGPKGSRNHPKIMKNDVQDRGLENVGKKHENQGSQPSWEALPLESQCRSAKIQPFQRSPKRVPKSFQNPPQIEKKWSRETSPKSFETRCSFFKENYGKWLPNGAPKCSRGSPFRVE